jgi:hypothetical protein
MFALPQPATDAGGGLRRAGFVPKVATNEPAYVDPDRAHAGGSPGLTHMKEPMRCPHSGGSVG